MRRRRAPLLAAVGLAALACTEPAPVRVGFVSGLSGRHSDLGISSRNGALLEVERLNAAGGVRGRPLELVIRDDRHDPETARRAVEDLVSQGVVAIVGHATSAMAEATLPIVNRERVLMVSPTVSASTFRGLDDWFVAVYPSTRESARALARHVARGGVGRRVAVLQDLSNGPFTRSWVEAFSGATGEAGGEIAGVVSFTSGAAPQWGALARKALETRPDAVLIVANAFDTGALAQQIRKAGSAVPILGTDWGFTNDAVANGGSALEGALFTLKIDITARTERMVAFRRDYEERFARPPDFAAYLSAEAVDVLATALATGVDRAGLRAAVLGRTYQGLEGPFQVDASGDTHREVHVMTVRDGRLIHVE